MNRIMLCYSPVHLHHCMPGRNFNVVPLHASSRHSEMASAGDWACQVGWTRACCLLWLIQAPTSTGWS